MSAIPGRAKWPSHGPLCLNDEVSDFCCPRCLSTACRMRCPMTRSYPACRSSFLNHPWCCLICGPDYLAFLSSMLTGKVPVSNQPSLRKTVPAVVLLVRYRTKSGHERPWISISYHVAPVDPPLVDPQKISFRSAHPAHYRRGRPSSLGRDLQEPHLQEFPVAACLASASACS